MKISPPCEADAPGIATVHVRAWQAAYGHILPADFLTSLSIEARAGRWREILKTSAARTLVARDAGGVIGFVSYGACRDEGAPVGAGEIWSLYVSPEAWGKGTGRALLTRALEDLQAQDLAPVSLWVLTQNHRAAGFYRAAGFREVSGSQKQFEIGGHPVEETAYMLAKAD